MRTAGVIVCLMAILMGWSVASVSAASPQGDAEPAIEADLDGRPIKPDLISSYYCHDFDYPSIHCFLSGADLEAAEAARATSSTALASCNLDREGAAGPQGYWLGSPHLIAQLQNTFDGELRANEGPMVSFGPTRVHSRN